MLLNLTHEITNCGLPSHIQERYVRYKQGNRAIVAWMTKYGPEKYKGRKTLPIKQLIALGQLLCEKAEDIGTLPADVDYYFTEVIKERTYLSQHFRGHRDQSEEDKIDTVNHEHFTKSLQDIHQILLTAGRPAAKATRSSRASSSSSASATALNYIPSNRYDQLASDAASDCGDSNDDETSSVATVETSATSECCHSAHTVPNCLHDDNADCEDFLDAEGELAVAMETTMFLERVNDAFAAIESHWTRAGRNETSTVAVACLTNVLCGKILHYASLYSNMVESNMSLSEMQKSVTMNKRPCKYQHEYMQCSTRFDRTFDLFSEVQAGINTQPKAVSSKTIQRPSDFIVSLSDQSKSQPHLAQHLVQNILESMRNSHDHKIEFTGVPCYAMLCNQLNSRPSASTELGSILIVSVLCVSYTAYVQALEKPSLASKPRIQALQMASKGASSIRQFINDKDVFPCQCVNTLGFRLAETAITLETFAKHNKWTLLMQSPQVASNHVMEILDICSYYGMHLFHYRQYVGAVLHSYNLMVTMGGFERSPVMEELCDMFKAVLFNGGGRPASNFTSSWLRYIGARLKFRKGKREQNHKDTWCMSIPAHAASRSAGLNVNLRDEVAIEPKFDYGTIDAVTKLKRSNWQAVKNDNETFSDLLGVPVGFEYSSSLRTSRGKRRNRRSNSLTHSRKSSSSEAITQCMSVDEPAVCSHMLPSLMTCLQDTNAYNDSKASAVRLPTARLNLFAVFYTMTRIIRRISNATHDEPSSIASPAERGSLCLCFTTLLLRGADRIQDTRRKSGRLDAKGATWSKNERECLQVVRDAIHAEIDSSSVGKNGQAWLWNI